MRFCMVCTFYPPYHFGGDALYVQSLARALQQEGHHVEVIHCVDAYRLRGDREDKITEDDGILVHSIRSPWGALSPLVSQQTGQPGFKRKVLNKLLALPFDVVNFHNISLMGGPGVLEMSQAPVSLYTLHEHWLLCPTHIFWKNQKAACDRPQCFRCCLQSGIPPQLWRYTKLARRAVEQVDWILSPSEFTAKLHREAGFSRVQVLPSFSGLLPGLQHSGKPSPARPRFLYTGRMTASKGIQGLVRDFSRLPEYDLHLAGDGELLEPLQAEYGHCSNITFLGRLSHRSLVERLQEATALILPSLAPEVFPLCILEAFACGTPAIASDAGGSSEAIRKTGGGLVYDQEQERMGCIRQLAENPELRNQLGSLAKKGYQEFYTVQRYLASYLKLIRETQERKAHPGMQPMGETPLQA